MANYIIQEDSSNRNSVMLENLRGSIWNYSLEVNVMSLTYWIKRAILNLSQVFYFLQLKSLLIDI